METIREGESTSLTQKCCKKANRHDEYKPADDFKKDLLPDSIRDDVLFRFIQILCSLTVRVVVTYAGNTHFGTGFVHKVDKRQPGQCPCPECKNLGTSKPWGKVTVSTALHVIREESLATMSECHLFYDREEQRDSNNNNNNQVFQTLYGLQLLCPDKKGDWCMLECATHDLAFLEKLDSWKEQYWMHGKSLQDSYRDSQKDYAIIVSHPHGKAKTVSIGKWVGRRIEKYVRDEQDWCGYSYDTLTCPGSSGALVYILGHWNDGFAFWFGHPPHHSEGSADKPSCSTVGVESNQ